MRLGRRRRNRTGNFRTTKFWDLLRRYRDRQRRAATERAWIAPTATGGERMAMRRRKLEVVRQAIRARRKR